MIESIDGKGEGREEGRKGKSDGQQQKEGDNLKQHGYGRRET